MIGRSDATRRLATPLVALLAALLGFARCHRPSAVATHPVTIRIPAPLSTTNPLQSTTSYEDDVMSLVHDTLVERDAQGHFVPAVARSWTRTADGIDFQLDPRATFSNGSVVTADDVLFTIRAALDPRSEAPRYAALLDAIDLTRSRATGTGSLHVAFRKPDTRGLASFRLPILRADIQRDFVPPGAAVTGCGPYVIAASTGERVVLRRRAHYWRALPALSTVVFRVLADDAVAWNAALTGDIDVTTVRTSVYAAARKDATIARRLRFVHAYDLSSTAVVWNTRRGPLGDRRIRQALSLAVDRDHLAQTLYEGTARAVCGPCVPGNDCYDPAASCPHPDPARAADLLGEAGCRGGESGVRSCGGHPLTVHLLVPAGSRSTLALAEALSREWKPLGCELVIDPTDAAALFAAVRSGTFDAALLAMVNEQTPDLFSSFHSSQAPPAGSNYARFSDPSIDALLLAVRNAGSVEARQAASSRAAAALSVQQPYLWLLQVETKWAVNRRLEGVEPSSPFGLAAFAPGIRGWRLTRE